MGELTSPVHLSPGCFYGRTKRAHRGNGFILSEAIYPAGFQVPRHTHELVYMAFLVRGGYWEEFRKGRIDFGPSSVVFQAPNEVRRGDISPRGAHLFHLELGPSWSQRLREMGPLPEDAEAYERGPVPRLASALYREFRAGDAASVLTIEGTLLTMLGHLVRARESDGARVPPWLRRVHERVQAEFTTALTLQDLAEGVGVNAIRLARAYPRHFGESVAATVRRLRVARVARRLEDSDAPLADVAAEAGFYDQSHFTRVFKSETGTTPAAYRRARTPS
jgi:AraC family transcriptional regulator